MSSEFAAGAAVVNITPPVGVWMAGYGARNQRSESVADELHAKALYLRLGDAEAALITSDLIGITPEMAQAVRARVAEASGIASERVMVCGSHTHFGPILQRYEYADETVEANPDEAYLDVTCRKMAGAVAMAKAAAQPALAEWESGRVETVSYNRRPKDRERRLVQSFEPLSDDHDLTLGPIDPEVGVLRVDAEHGARIATVVNFAAHAVVGTGEFYALSADYPAAAMAVVERATDAPCLFTLGCCGNVNPSARGGRAERERIGAPIGAEAFRVSETLKPSLPGKLLACRERVELPLKAFGSPREARALADEHIGRIRRLRESGADEGAIAAARAEALPIRWRARYAERYAGHEALTTEVQAICLGDSAILGLPGEVFVEIGLAIKGSSPFARPMVCEVANDYCGYIPTRAAYQEGGYEPTWNRVAPGAGEQLTDAAVRLLQDCAARAG